MPQIQESTIIYADRDRLWALMTTPQDILQWFVGLDTLEASADYPAAGSSQNWTYKVMGLEFKGANTVTESVPGEAIHYSLSGLMTGTMNYDLREAVGGGIQLDVHIDYQMSGGLLGKLAEPVVHQMNAGNARKSIQNLKNLAEAT